MWMRVCNQFFRQWHFSLCISLKGEVVDRKWVITLPILVPILALPILALPILVLPILVLPILVKPTSFTQSISRHPPESIWACWFAIPARHP